MPIKFDFLSKKYYIQIVILKNKFILTVEGLNIIYITNYLHL